MTVAPAPATTARATLPPELRTYTSTAIATATLKWANHTESVRIGLSPAGAVRLPAVVSVPDAVRAAQDIMGFPSPSWAVTHAQDGTRYLVPTVTLSSSGTPNKGFNLDADAITVLSVDRTTDALDALVGYHTARTFTSAPR